MSGEVARLPPRPRPLSGGLWTLFSWLRRDEHSSSESLSSVGSDRTVASFAFLAPAHYGSGAPAPLPPPPPPTDSYRKRVRDRNLRRLHDRDITLQRKYGLYGFGYDALSLPSGRRAAAPGPRCERDRRATSESPRAHVPGKRRAPPPPSGASSLTRPKARKRPAPLPPVKENFTADVKSGDNTDPMNRQPLSDKRPPQNHDNAMDCKPEKHSKKDAQSKETKDVKVRHEKSFLKHIFENRKRNSAIETTSVKLLPNISELDKQAVEMIEKYRLKELSQDKELGKNDSPGSSKQQMEAWICTRCLRKYNSSVITCNYCLPLNKVNDSYRNSKVLNNFTQTNRHLNDTATESLGKRAEDKEKLKEMLKEMKDSLPKRYKNNPSAHKKDKVDNKEDYSKTVEAPTLRIGSSDYIDNNNPIPQTSSTSRFDTEVSLSQRKSQDINKAKEKPLATINSVVITQPVVLVHTKSNVVVLKDINAKHEVLNKIPLVNDDSDTLRDSPKKNMSQREIIKSASSDAKPLNNVAQTKYDLNTPLKISSLLNPIYIPKTTSSTNTQTPNFVKQAESNDVESPNSFKSTTSENIINVTQIKDLIPNVPPTRKDNQKAEPSKKVENKESVLNEKNVHVKDEGKKTENTNVKTYKLHTGLSSSVDGASTSQEGRVDQHARRRDLINQLEKSIAKGDEHAAAEAAVKLAQLRLSCSVLSFSSQIVAAPVTEAQQTNVMKPVNESITEKREEVIQKSSSTNISQIKAPMQQSNENILILNVDKNNVIEEEILETKENVFISKTANASDQCNIPKLESASKIKFTSQKKCDVSHNPAPCEASTSKTVASKKEDDTNEDVPILVWVEDKEATRGPVQLHVRRDAVIGDLRGHAERSLGLAARMQRWIVGKTLCSDDNTPLATLAGPGLTAPFYLCLVESDTKDASRAQVEKINENIGDVYNELVKLEKQALVSNTEVFECEVCIEECGPGHGVVLRECIHSFCKECLSDVVRHSEEPVVSCPAMGCRGFLQEREIRGLVSAEDYEKLLARGLAAAESGTRNAFHCRTRDCTGWALCEPGVRRFPCPVCKRTNCVPCQAIHEAETCEQHRTKIQESAASSDANQTDEGTQALLNTLISRGEALECPECSAIITKKWGCDWVKCSACKTEICWVTKGRRWGPAGRGDTSAGCRCGVDGKRCHPSCGYCH